MPISFANQSGQKSLDDKKGAEFQNGSKVQISFADISNQGLDLEGKQNGNQQSKFDDLPKAVHNLKEQPGETRPKSTYKSKQP